MVGMKSADPASRIEEEKHKDLKKQKTIYSAEILEAKDGFLKLKRARIMKGPERILEEIWA